MAEFQPGEFANMPPKLTATGTVDGTPRTVEVWKSALPTDAEPDKQLALQTGFLVKQLLGQIPTEPIKHELPFSAIIVADDGSFKIAE